MGFVTTSRLPLFQFTMNFGITDNSLCYVRHLNKLWSMRSINLRFLKINVQFSPITIWKLNKLWKLLQSKWIRQITEWYQRIWRHICCVCWSLISIWNYGALIESTFVMALRDDFRSPTFDNVIIHHYCFFVSHKSSQTCSKGDYSDLSFYIRICIPVS